MIQEELVSLDIAKLLRARGFNEGTIYYYSKEGDLVGGGIDYEYSHNSELSENEFSAPSLGQVLKWMREVKKIYVEVSWLNFKYFWDLIIIEGKEAGRELNCNSLGYRINNNFYKSYEKAVEAALNYFFKLLYRN